MSVSLTVSAASSQSGTLAGKKVSGSVAITANGGSATTRINVAPNTGGSATVNLSYSYINLNTNVVTTITGGAHHTVEANASRGKPNGNIYRSVKTNATHQVKYSGQTWNASTEIFY